MNIRPPGLLTTVHPIRRAINGYSRIDRPGHAPRFWPKEEGFKNRNLKNRHMEPGNRRVPDPFERVVVQCFRAQWDSIQGLLVVLKHFMFIATTSKRKEKNSILFGTLLFGEPSVNFLQEASLGAIQEREHAHQS